MLVELLVFLLGLFVAWFFFPAPQVAIDFRNWLTTKMPFLASLTKKN